jgi:hypothetical protein
MAISGAFQNSNYPLWFHDIEYWNIAIQDFDPPGQQTQYNIGDYMSNGFGVKNATATAGYIYAITWYQYESDGHNSFIDFRTGLALVPRRIDLDGYDWCITPLAKVFADNDANYPSTITAINVGKIL